MGEVGLFKCPFCPCEFCSQVDLDIHLDAFGRCEHSLKLSNLRESFANEASLLHGGADCIISEFRSIILDYFWGSDRIRRKRVGVPVSSIVVDDICGYTLKPCSCLSRDCFGCEVWRLACFSPRCPHSGEVCGFLDLDCGNCVVFSSLPYVRSCRIVGLEK